MKWSGSWTVPVQKRISLFLPFYCVLLFSWKSARKDQQNFPQCYFHDRINISPFLFWNSSSVIWYSLEPVSHPFVRLFFLSGLRENPFLAWIAGSHWWHWNTFCLCVCLLYAGMHSLYISGGFYVWAFGLRSFVMLLKAKACPQGIPDIVFGTEKTL